MNTSKLYDKRCWQTWEDSGAIGTLEDALTQSFLEIDKALLCTLQERAKEQVHSLYPPAPETPGVLVVLPLYQNDAFRSLVETSLIYRRDIFVL